MWNSLENKHGFFARINFMLEDAATEQVNWLSGWELLVVVLARLDNTWAQSRRRATCSDIDGAVLLFLRESVNYYTMGSKIGHIKFLKGLIMYQRNDMLFLLNRWNFSVAEHQLAVSRLECVGTKPGAPNVAVAVAIALPEGVVAITRPGERQPLWQQKVTA